MKMAFTTAACVNFAVLVAALLLAYLNQEMFWDNFILATIAFSIIGASLLGFIIAAVVYILRSKNDRVSIPIQSRNNYGNGYHPVSDAHGPYGKQPSKTGDKNRGNNRNEIIENVDKEYSAEDSGRNYISDLEELSGGVNVEFTQPVVDGQ